MKYAMMVREYYDGVLVRRADGGLMVRVMYREVVPLEWVPLEWVRHPSNKVSDVFVELPLCFGTGYRDACRSAECSYGRECDEHRDKNKKEEVMGKLETVGEPMERTGGCFGLRYDKDNHGCQSCNDSANCKRCVAMIGNLPTGTVDSFAGRINHKAVAEFKKVRELLEANAPDVMRHAEGNVLKATQLVLDGLDSSVTAFKALEADLDGMQAADGCERRRELDGTFAPRAGNPSLVRRRGGVHVGCDDQSGEDVCADADGWKDGLR